MKWFAIDTNLLVYSHQLEAKYHQSAKAWLERIMNERDEQGNLSVCLPAQVLMEFVNVITWQQLKQPLSLSEAKRVVHRRKTTPNPSLERRGINFLPSFSPPY
jgi:hypothetical protein